MDLEPYLFVGAQEHDAGNTGGIHKIVGSEMGYFQPDMSVLQSGIGEEQTWIYRIIPDLVPNILVTVVTVVVVLVITWLVTRVLDHLIRHRISRHINQPLSRILMDSIRIGVGIIGLFIASVIVGYQPLNILFSTGFLTAIIGGPLIAILRNSLLILFLPYGPGDVIELPARNQMGVVEEITTRNTKIYTFDKTLIIVSNRRMRKQDIINYSIGDERTRQSLDLLVTYDSDIEEACDVMKEAATDVDSVISGAESSINIGDEEFPANPTCHINRYADNGVLLTLRFWTDEPYRLLTIRDDIQKGIWERIKNKNREKEVDIPFPHRQLLIDDEHNEMHVVLEDTRTVTE